VSDELLRRLPSHLPERGAAREEAAAGEGWLT
jgi:hypothetical protein